MFDAGMSGFRFSEWLYGSYDQEKLMQFEVLYHLPVIGSYMDYLLDIRSDEEYMHRYGLKYSDIHDPRKLHQVSSGSRVFSSGFNFVSKNVEKLYR